MTTRRAREYISDRMVLIVISGGLISILLCIIAGLFGWFKARANVPLPNWAENVLVSIATACALKLGDCLSTLVALASGRQVGDISTKLANSAPADALGATAIADATLNSDDRPTGLPGDPVATTVEEPQP